MRRLTAVVASGLLLGGFVLASPAAWADHGSSNGLEDFDLTGEITDAEKDDTGDKGPSEGDTFTVKMDLVDEHGDEAGDGEGTCEATEVDRDAHEFTADCEGVFHLDGDDLAMSGQITQDDFKDKEIVMDIDGDVSTGDYEGAAGTVTFTRAEDHGDGGHHAHSVRTYDHSGDGGGGHDKGHGHHKVDIAVDFE